MKSFKIAILLLFISLCQPEGLFSQVDKCPTSAGFKDNLCFAAGYGFYMTGSNVLPQMGPVVLNFGGTDQNCNGSMDIVHVSCASGHYFGDNTLPYCTDPSPSGTITFNNGLVCAYIEGALVPCNDLVTECQQPLIDFAKDFLPQNPNCKLWEGPCAVESEIWRTGNVTIGANTGPYGYKLSVGGGITTEMLQICKPEWCDYVFSDTFQLMPLKAVKKHIQQNGFLPGCTSNATIVQSGGFLLDDESVHQQQKIEEIFLHLIRAQHQMDNIDQKIGTQLPLTTPTKSAYPEMVEHAPTNNNLLQMECFQVKTAPNGVGGILVTPYSGPYTVSWSGAGNGSMNHIVCNGTIMINNLAAGNYSVTVTNATGATETCSFSIANGGTSNSCEVLSDPLCQQAILNLLENEAFNDAPTCKQWEGDPCSETVDIYHLGNVEIGTSVGRAGYSLAVKGGIVTDKFKVELCESHGWCDYVFEEGYPLQSLYAVESFIKAQKHLPGTISQDEVTDRGGFEMRSVKLDHQKKIEEAYLYLIALDKKKKELQQRLITLSDQN